MNKKKESRKYIYAVGRRKEAVATVKLFKGKGETLVNGKLISNYFSGAVDRFYYERPFEITKTKGRFYALVKVVGGGKEGQLEAVSLAFSRALVKFNSQYRLLLRNSGLLTVDGRVRERRKAGQMGRARKKKQSPKR